MFCSVWHTTQEIWNSDHRFEVSWSKRLADLWDPRVNRFYFLSPDPPTSSHTENVFGVDLPSRDHIIWRQIQLRIPDQQTKNSQTVKDGSRYLQIYLQPRYAELLESVNEARQNSFLHPSRSKKCSQLTWSWICWALTETSPSVSKISKFFFLSCYNFTPIFLCVLEAYNGYIMSEIWVQK